MRGGRWCCGRARPRLRRRRSRSRCSFTRSPWRATGCVCWSSGSTRTPNSVKRTRWSYSSTSRASMGRSPRSTCCSRTRTTGSSGHAPNRAPEGGRVLPTPRQKEILEAVRSLTAERGAAPTLRDIASRVGLASVSTVHKHLALLEERGLLRRRRRRRRREIELLPEAQLGAAVEVPLLGRIVAGRPIQTGAGVPRGALPKDPVPGPRTYGLQGKGGSMLEGQVLDGDYI